MSKLVILLIVLMGFIMLFTTACGNGDSNNNNNTITTPIGIEDLTPGVAEWAIMLLGGDFKSTYQVSVVWIGGTTLPQIGDNAVLLINNNNVTLQSYSPGVLFGSCEATQGADATIKFVYNDVTKIDSTIKPVTVINGADFPTSYNPTQSSTFTWTLPTNNQHQVAGVSAYKDNYPAESWSGENMKEIEIGARSYTVPANPIANVPEGAAYTLGVSEVNYKIVNKIALLSINGAWSDQYMKNASPNRMSAFARNMLNTLTK